MLLILVQCNEEMSTDLQCTHRITFKNSINRKREKIQTPVKQTDLAKLLELIHAYKFRQSPIATIEWSFL
jgi:hypothetical protein